MITALYAALLALLMMWYYGYFAGITRDERRECITDSRYRDFVSRCADCARTGDISSRS